MDGFNAAMAALLELLWETAPSARRQGYTMTADHATALLRGKTYLDAAIWEAFAQGLITMRVSDETRPERGHRPSGGRRRGGVGASWVW
jgi:hypothetical protein